MRFYNTFSFLLLSPINWYKSKEESRTKCIRKLYVLRKTIKDIISINRDLISFHYMMTASLPHQKHQLYYGGAVLSRLSFYCFKKLSIFLIRKITVVFTFCRKEQTLSRLFTDFEQMEKNQTFAFCFSAPKKIFQSSFSRKKWGIQNYMVLHWLQNTTYHKNNFLCIYCLWANNCLNLWSN